MSGRALRLVMVSTLVAGLLSLAPAAQGHATATLTLNVAFFPNGTITVTLPDGTPVGSTSGAPTVIPAGYYTVLMSGPGGCTYLPLFELKGPGEDIYSDMNGGELNTNSRIAYFMPNSTYTWRNFGAPAAVYTFKTSVDILGTQPAPLGASPSGKETAVSSQDVIGSALIPFRGSMAGAVSPAGRLTLSYKGKSVTTLRAGRYTITIIDRSLTSGLMLSEVGHKMVSVTGVAFVGNRSVSVRLTAGRWIFTTRLGKATHSIVIS